MKTIILIYFIGLAVSYVTMGILNYIVECNKDPKFILTKGNTYWVFTSWVYIIIMLLIACIIGVGFLTVEFCYLMGKICKYKFKIKLSTLAPENFIKFIISNKEIFFPFFYLLSVAFLFVSLVMFPIWVTALVLILVILILYYF